MSATQQEKDFMEKYKDKLSPTTLRAAWVNEPGDAKGHDGETFATRSHEVIKRWANERDATPATVPGTEHGDHLGVLRLQFPGYGGKDLQSVSWEEWFKTFDDRKLVFLYQEKLSNGHQSNFFHFDSPFREHD